MVTQTSQPRTYFSDVHPGTPTNQREIPIIGEEILFRSSPEPQRSGNPFLNSSRNYGPPKERFVRIFSKVDY
jgi:hypothetical protein